MNTDPSRNPPANQQPADEPPTRGCGDVGAAPHSPDRSAAGADSWSDVASLQNGAGGVGAGGVFAATSPRSARICRSCTNLVTTDETCPLCNKPTKPHPQRNQKDHYCVGCAKGPFTADLVHLVTWNADPYSQTDDGDLNCLCGSCRVEQGEEVE